MKEKKETRMKGKELMKLRNRRRYNKNSKKINGGIRQLH